MIFTASPNVIDTVPAIVAKKLITKPSANYIHYSKQCAEPSQATLQAATSMHITLWLPAFSQSTLQTSNP